MRMIAPTVAGMIDPSRPATEMPSQPPISAPITPTTVAKKAEPAATHNQPGERAGDGTDQKKDEEIRECHLMPSNGASLDSYGVSPLESLQSSSDIIATTEFARWRRAAPSEIS